MSHLKINSLKVTPAYRLTEPGPNSIAFATTQLWPQVSTTTTPLALQYNSAFTLNITSDTSVPTNLTCDVVFKAQVRNPTSNADSSHDQVFAKTTTPLNVGKAGTADFQIPATSFGVPWGGQIKLDIYLTTHGSATQTLQPVPTFSVELYFLTPNIAPAFSGGIPYEFVSLFVLPPGLVDSYTNKPDFWIERTTRLCHMSGWDVPNPKPFAVEALRDASSTLTLPNGASKLIDAPIHWYRYDVYQGGSTFLFGPLATTFDIDSWVRFRLDKTGTYTVNCYDQAHLLNCALNLGLAFNVSGKTDKTIGIWYAGIHTAMFGFINTVDLIGWGQTNNPFFMSNTPHTQVVPEDNLDSDLRDPFGNHQWVCIRTTDGGGNIVCRAVDACAGPAAVPTTVTQYLQKTVDMDPKVQTYLNKKNWTVLPSTWNPAPGPNDELLDPIAGIDAVARGMNVELAFASFPDIITAFWNTTKHSDYIQGSPAGRTYQSGVNLSTLSQQVKTTAVCNETTRVVDVKSNKTTITSTFTAGTPSTTTPVPPTSTTGTGLPFLSLEVAVFKTRDLAVLDTLNAFRLSNANPSTIWKVPTTRRGVYDLVTTNASVNNIIVVYQNVRITLTGSAPANTFNNVATAIDTFFANAQNSLIPLSTDAAINSSIHVTNPAAFPVGLQNNIVVQAPAGTADVSIASKNGNLRIDNTFARTGTVPPWSFTTFATAAGPEQLQIWYTELNTFYPLLFTDSVHVG